MRKAAYTGLNGTAETAKRKAAPQPKTARARIAGGREVQTRIPQTVQKKTTPKPTRRIAYGNKEITATELKKHTADAIQSALKAPVTILKNGRPLIVIISQEQFEHFMRLQQASLKKPFPYGIR
jgi:prevent-host-death family protein